MGIRTKSSTHDLEVLGLRGFRFFYVYGVFAIAQIETGLFPVAMASGVVTYLYIKFIVDKR